MHERNLNAVDRLVSGLDAALRTVVVPATRHTRENPAADLEEASLDAAEKRHAAGLMRVNHAGEVAAQGLYQGHAALARDLSTMGIVRSTHPMT